MALVIFRSKAAADITMFAESARRIFEIIGRPESARGVITADQIPDALQRLTTAVEQDKAQQRASDATDDEVASKGLQARGVTFSQRAFPLIEMLRAAQKKRADVTWGA
ncbi:MAG TPA: DUF1840 domain-containing protein [Burkholderiaceae bacterium]|jgi:hypothetical protein|nr:DUF1840 domain-containing protein [Burkholderiaceae bacterium]